MRGYTITERYEPVELRAEKTGKCVCGKRLKRATTLSQTLSPFNKKDGRLKTRSEIMDELWQERDEWLREPVSHYFADSFFKMSEQERAAYDRGETVMRPLTCGELGPLKKKTV